MRYRSAGAGGPSSTPWEDSTARRVASDGGMVVTACAEAPAVDAVDLSLSASSAARLFLHHGASVSSAKSRFPLGL